MYHPKWTNNPDFITVSGPYDANRGGSCPSRNCGNLIMMGGKRMNIYIGKLNADRTHAIKWLRITNNNVPEFFGDAWIGTEPPKPELILVPATLEFVESLADSGTVAGTVIATGLYGLGLGGMEVSESAPWLSVSVSGKGRDRALTNTVSIAGLAAGVKSIRVTVSAQGKSKQYTVSLSVIDLAKLHQKINFGSRTVPGWKAAGVALRFRNRTGRHSSARLRNNRARRER